MAEQPQQPQPQGEQGKPDNQQAPPGQQQQQQQPTAEQLAATVNDLRKQLRASEAKFSKLEQEHMSEQEKAIAKARAEGKAEAVVAAGKKLAAAEFKAMAAGKLADPATALEVLDLSRFVDETGEVDTKGLQAVVEKLVSLAPQPDKHAPRIPAGPREDGAEPDFLRAKLRG